MKNKEIILLFRYLTATIPGTHNESSCSSNPESPNTQGDNNGRTQYVSATCVVVTHYSGDVANVVDEHFTRALSFNDKNSKGEFSSRHKKKCEVNYMLMYYILMRSPAVLTTAHYLCCCSCWL
jgi:hypothetical protein